MELLMWFLTYVYLTISLSTAQESFSKSFEYWTSKDRIDFNNVVMSVLGATLCGLFWPIYWSFKAIFWYAKEVLEIK